VGEEKIVPLRRGIEVRGSAHELPLFGDPSETHGKVAYIDLGKLTQEEFFRILSRNGVKSIIDLRSVPVFRRPQFLHSQIADYLMSQKITYVDLTLVPFRSMHIALLNLLASQPHQLLGKIAQALDNGLTLVLYDQDTRETNAVSDLRRFLASHSSFRAEIHPSALAK